MLLTISGPVVKITDKELIALAVLRGAESRRRMRLAAGQIAGQHQGRRVGDALAKIAQCPCAVPWVRLRACAARRS